MDPHQGRTGHPSLLLTAEDERDLKPLSGRAALQPQLDMDATEVFIQPTALTSTLGSLRLPNLSGSASG